MEAVDWVEIGPHRIACGDAREILPTLEAGSVQCVVTSPPYWGLRDYGTADWEGGDPECDHQGPPHRTASNINRSCGTGVDRKNAERREPMGAFCDKCGARRIDSQLGLEPTPEEYVAKLVVVFGEVRRVLRDDGTLWLNLGDSYCHDAKWGGSSGKKNKARAGYPRRNEHGHSGLKPKDLVGIPWRVAFALQADGWYLRQDIIWSKPNPMPESVTDRCTKAHEYLFLLMKSARYHYDAEAIAEALAGQPHAPGNLASGRLGSGGKTDNCVHQSDRVWGLNGKRNRRSVWTIPTQPYSDAHFATFPEALVEPCILAGCPAGGTVLDPFVGSGTTLLVAGRHGCKGIGIELNAEYLALAKKRIGAEAAQGKLDLSREPACV